MRTKLIILFKYCFYAVMFPFAFDLKLITLLLLCRPEEVVLLVHFPVLPKPIFTGSTRSRAFHKGTFLFHFLKNYSMQNRKAFPLLFSTCYCGKSTSNRNTVFAPCRFVLLGFTVCDAGLRAFLTRPDTQVNN